jgi:prefoldin subunit 5
LEQVVDGEIKQTTPRWIGISGINGLLDGLKGQINILKADAISNLKTHITNIDTAKGNYKEVMETFDDVCFNEGNYLNDYIKLFNDIDTNNHYYGKSYFLDIIKLVGHRDTDNNYPDETFLYYLNREYAEVAERTDGYVQTANTSFHNILKSKTDDIIKALDKAKDTLNKLKKPFDKINNQIGDKISDYSKQIDDKGKLGVKLVFGVLMIMNVALGVFVIFIGLCSMKSCKDCCFCRCLFKFCTHLLWNILALLMILSFIIGSILSLVGRIGGDAMELVSYTLSEENLNNDADPFLIGQADDVKKYLKICLHGNGSLESEFDLGDSLQSIEDIDEVLNGLGNVKQEFEEIKENLPAFKTFNEQIKNRKDLLTDTFALLYRDNPDDLTQSIPFQEALKSLNDEISVVSTNKER